MSKISWQEILLYISVFLGGFLVDLNYKFEGIIIVGLACYNIGLIHISKIIKKGNRRCRKNKSKNKK